MVGVELLFDVVVEVVVVLVVEVGDLLATTCIDLSEDIPAQGCLGGLACSGSVLIVGVVAVVIVSANAFAICAATRAQS